jgi:hypothetical protein
MPGIIPNDRLAKRNALDSVLFHKLTSGDPESFVSQFFVLLSDVLEKQSQPQPTDNLNGSQPSELKPSQSEALTKLLAGTKKSVEELAQEVRELARAVKHRVEPESRPENILSKWGIRVGIVAAAAAIGFFVCHENDLRQANANERLANQRLVAAMSSLPTAANVTTYLRSKGGDVTIGPIKGTDGRETSGIIIKPGEAIQFTTPSFAADGRTALVPIK